MIPFWWACCTAWQTATNNSSRARTGSRLRSQYSVIGSPWTSSITKNGWPASVVPPSKTRAMLGWSIKASACRSASNRASTARESMPILISFSATCRLTGAVWLCPINGAHAPLAEDFEQRVPAGDDLARDRSAGAVGRRNLFNRGPSAAGSVFRGRQFRGWTRFRGRSPRRILGFERDRLGPWHGLGRGGFAFAGGLGFQGQAYRALDGEQRLDPGPEFGFPAALPVQVGGTLRRGGEV